MPKGKRARRISLKFCLPKGMPIIVIQKITPQKRCVRAMANPPKNHQMTFMMPARQPDGKPPLLSTYVPKGQSATCASLMVCRPNGIPMMVIIIARLERMYSIATIRPPKITQIMLSSVFIGFSSDLIENSVAKLRKNSILS